MKGPTSVQIEIYNFIKQEIRSRGVPPTIREISDAVNLSSTSSIHHNLKMLEKYGYIKRSKYKNRCIEILEKNFYEGENSDNFDSEFVNIPIIGTVAAGTPIFADEHIEGYFPVPAAYLTNSTTFMLRIKGNSMVNAGIYNDDLVLVRQQATAENGEIIIALIDDSATCKRYFKDDGYIRLQPENDSYEPIFVRELNILGKVTGLFRSYK
jgi:repressor LexA